VHPEVRSLILLDAKRLAYKYCISKRRATKLARNPCMILESTGPLSLPAVFMPLGRRGVLKHGALLREEGEGRRRRRRRRRREVGHAASLQVRGRGALENRTRGRFDVILITTGVGLRICSSPKLMAHLLSRVHHPH